MNVLSSMQRLWRVALCLLLLLLGMSMHADSFASRRIVTSFLIEPFGGELARLDAIRDCLTPFGRNHGSLLVPSPESGMNFEVSTDLAYTLRVGRYRPPLAFSGLVQFIRAEDLYSPASNYGQLASGSQFYFIRVKDFYVPTTNYDKVVTDALQASEGWRIDADVHLLESLSGPEDPAFFDIIEWQMKLEE